MKGFCSDCGETYYANESDIVICERCGFKTYVFEKESTVESLTVFKDAVGNVLHVGDEIAFSQFYVKGRQGLQFGTISKLNPTQVSIVAKDDQRKTSAMYSNVMKVIRENA